jgi:predicted phosphodiesterase
MRVAILSDIHANLEALRATLQKISGQAVDRIVCLGDVVGCNTNPAECIALLRERNALWVAGNHDRAVCGQITTTGFSETAARAITWTRRHLSADLITFLANLPLKAAIGDHLVVVHGALHPDAGCELVRLDNNERRLLSFKALSLHPSGARICAFGHTHRAGIFELRDGTVRAWACDEVLLRGDSYYLVNPGTVGQSLTSDRRATYLVLDTAHRLISLHRVEYDFSIPIAKSRRAGLLPRSSLVPKTLKFPLKRTALALGLYNYLKRSGW